MARFLVVSEDGTHTVELAYEDPTGGGDFDTDPYWVGWCTCTRFDLTEGGTRHTSNTADALAAAEVHVEHHH